MLRLAVPASGCARTVRPNRLARSSGDAPMKPSIAKTIASGNRRSRSRTTRASGNAESAFNTSSRAKTALRISLARNRSRATVTTWSRHSTADFPRSTWTRPGIAVAASAIATAARASRSATSRESGAVINRCPSTSPITISGTTPTPVAEGSKANTEKAIGPEPGICNSSLPRRDSSASARSAAPELRLNETSSTAPIPTSVTSPERHNNPVLAPSETKSKSTSAPADRGSVFRPTFRA